MISTQANSRQRAEIRGRRSEWLAGVWLRAKGYKILSHRHRTPFGELDLICEKRNLVVFVEVKARKSRSAGLEAVTLSSQKRLANAASHWLARTGRHCDVRFDVIVHRGGLRMFHLRDAWRPDFALTGI